MSNATAPVVLRHGTTTRRANQLLVRPPDPNFIEPGGDPYSRAGGFSAVVAGQTALGLGMPEQYAQLKSQNFPNEGGPAILEVEVPEWIMNILRNDPIAAAVMASGEMRFEPDLGLAELRQAWPTLTKRVVAV